MGRRDYRRGFVPKYPKDLSWDVGLVRRIVDDELRVAVVIVRPRKRHFLPIVGPSDDWAQRAVDALTQVYLEADWWARPQFVRVVESELAELIEMHRPLREVTLRHVNSLRTLVDAQDDFYEGFDLAA